ncbi:YIP1 family protein [Aquisalimonas lutea]|uniref:YIP1 family protein n=1 Tax=Aquisalimonas lutea TaxID=1327750 RepID=UPI0025B2E466|nr:YIP1 family protein [Aquisalimonas lutea]MDN3516373.1 YIP1 family protein [Aquisalimonas lutea]
MSSFTERVIGAARLDPSIYEEVEHDPGAVGQAVGVVLLSSVAAGIGSMLYMDLGTSLIVGSIAALLGWLIWAFLTWLIGTKLLPEAGTEADMGQLLRTIGFASAPGILRFLGVIPGIGGLIVLACNIWMLAAMVVGVRQALDYTSTWRAVGVCVIGWVILIVLQGAVFAMVGAPGLGG